MLNLVYNSEAMHVLQDVLGYELFCYQTVQG